MNEMIQNHEIDFKIFGEEMQYVEVELDPNETAIAEPGAFMMMEDGIQMETLPISRLAGHILQYATTSRREEGSVLGGIGNLLDGDGWR